MNFVDTNYFLRFLIDEKNKQHEQAVILFRKASLGKIKLITSTIVIFEIYWVLSSFYQKDKKEVKKILTNILKMNFIEIKEREILIEAVNLLPEVNYDLEDAYNLILALNLKNEEFLTFDKMLKRKFKEKRS